MRVDLQSASAFYTKHNAASPFAARFTRGATTICAALAVAGAAFFTSFRSPAFASTPIAAHYKLADTPSGDSIPVYLYVNGEPQLISTDNFTPPPPGYTSGHVYTDDDELVGTVPDPTEGHIYDSNNNCLGFICPSQASLNEL